MCKQLQLLWDFSPDLHRSFAPGPHWGLLKFRPPAPLPALSGNKQGRLSPLEAMEQVLPPNWQMQHTFFGGGSFPFPSSLLLPASSLFPSLSPPFPFAAKRPLNATMGSGECCKLPQWGPGQSPGSKSNFDINLSFFWVQKCV